MKDELKKKLQRMKELATIIQLSGSRFLTKEQKQADENERYKLEFQLGELVIRSKIEEADLKIKAMENIVKLLKNE